MTQEVFDKVANALLDKAEKIRNSKGVDYSEDNDRLSNFKNIAREMGCKPSLVWAVYFRKHIDAVIKHTRCGQTESEPIEDRLADIINYCLLYQGLVEEGKAGEPVGTVAIYGPRTEAALRDVPKGASFLG